MALELIYTSAPRGLRAGASGYCTVAQTRGMREDLVAALERRSLFTHEPKGDSPVYFSYRTLSLGGTTWRVLSRGLDAGLDFTGRRHYLIHHLVMEISEELPGVQPVEILLGWSGWRDSWSGSPVHLEVLQKTDSFFNLARIVLPAREWKRQTGDAGWAVAPSQMPSPVGWQAEGLSSTELLQLMGESTALMENTQPGGSWLVTMDVGGAANPISKDCLWSGRTLWAGMASMTGVRSILRIEDCRGKEPRGRAEDIEMARSGPSRAISRKGTNNPHSLATESGVAPRIRSGREPENCSRWKPVALTGILLAGVMGVGSLFFRSSPNSTSSQAPPDPTTEKEPQRVIGQLPKKIFQQPESPGQALARLLWTEVGGGEKVEVLYLLFEPPSVKEINERLGQLFAQSGGIARPHHVEGWTGPVMAQSNLSEFSRKACKQITPWGLYATESASAMAFVPCAGISASAERRGIPSGEMSPHEVLLDLTRHVPQEPFWWFLRIKFPPFENMHFPDVKVEKSADEEDLFRSWNRYREEIMAKRMRALCSALQSSGQDPRKWSEPKIREVAKDMEFSPTPETYKEFLRLHKAFLASWDLPMSERGAKQVFRSLLKNREASVEVWLSGVPELVVGRLIP